MTGTPPPLTAGTAPPPRDPHSGSGRSFLAIVLSLCLGAFLADAVVSLADDSLIVFLGVRLLTPLRVIVFSFTALVLAITYVSIGFSPRIPRRVFLPLTLFLPLVELAVVPVLIHFSSWFRQIAWAVSLAQFTFGLVILSRLHGGLKRPWPLFPASRLVERRFRWRDPGLFVALNVFVLIPATLAYLYFCGTLAVAHFSDGFMTLSPGGFTVQARKYVRADGRTIHLFPMSHIGERDFYQRLSESFTNNSVILMEGVSDDGNLLTNKISYQRAAETLQLAEQHKEFRPVRSQVVSADVDVSAFTPGTIAFLNLTMLFHSRGANATVMQQLMDYSPPPGFEEQLLEDLIYKRNRNLLQQIQARLPDSERIVVPWGVMHMPEIAREIQRMGFHLDETREYPVIRFHWREDASERAVEEGNPRRRK